MYSMVLMAALTTGSGTPDSWCHHGYHGGYGGGGWAPNCSGVYGGYYYGMPYGGYASGGYGGNGGNGCFGCYGGSWGHGWGWGGGIDYNCFGCHGCYGCYGGFGCTGYLPGGVSANVPEPIPAPRVDEKKGGGTGAVVPNNRAKVVVQLPPDAKLYVDDQPIKTTADRQTFNTPQLQRGQTYFYEVRAEAVRDGKTVAETRRVLIRAGQEVTVDFPKLGPPADVAAADSSRR
jgi:uncharacterized protein (TIGR03000 family)